MTAAVARAIVRFRFAVVAAWVVATAASIVFLPTPGAATGGALGSLVPDNSLAVLAQRRSAELFSFPILGNTVVVQRDPEGLTVGQQSRVVSRARRITERDYGELLSVPFALPLINTLGVVPGSREENTTALTYLFFKPGTGLQDRRKLANWFIDRRFGADAPTVVGETGIVPARVEQGALIEDALPLVELATVLLVALVVGVTFRGLLAPVVTLASVAVAYVVSRATIAVAADWAGQGVPREVDPLLLVLLLGIVTDYSIFLLSSLRHRLQAGDDRLAAAVGSTRVNLPIIGTAALIVAAGAAALAVARLDFFRVFGPALALAVLVGLAVSQTLVPALLAILGRAVFWPSRPAARARHGDRPGLAVRLVTSSRRGAFAVAAGATLALGTAALGLGGIRLAVTPIAELPDESVPARAAAAAAEGFAPGVLSPTLVIVEDHALYDAEEALVRLQRELERLPGVAAVIGPGNIPDGLPVAAVRSRSGTGARYVVLLEGDPLSTAAIDDLKRIRAELRELRDEVGLPAAAISIGGNTAIAQETISVIKRDIGRITVAVLAVNLLLLILFLRALVAPVLVLLASVLAVTASLGITVLVVDLLGWELTYYVPFMAAVLLVSLGSDYNVFLIGWIWQEAERMPVTDAVRVATPRAAHAIAAAAVALALSFALLALVPLWSFRELAVAMVVGVLIDAFVVRSWLVPALIVLAGRTAAWPGPLWRRRLRPSRPASGAVG